MILVTGATGFLGKRICRELDRRGLQYTKTSLTLGVDLRDAHQVEELFQRVGPTQILNCAAYVGGIQFGYKHPAELFHNNLLMALNLLSMSSKYKIKRIVNPISNCAYPAAATLFKEEEFWNGPLHESVLAYGFARKASWVGAWAYYKQYSLDVINLILSNMYGPEDHFEEERSHALGALVMKFVKARDKNLESVTVWGTGKPIREWLHVDDGASAMIRSLEIEPYVDPINIGVASGISIGELANIIKEIVGFRGDIIFDPTKPDGAPFKTVEGSLGRKLLSWSPETDLRAGIAQTVKWYEEEGMK